METKGNVLGNSSKKISIKNSLTGVFYVFAIKASTFLTMFLEPINMGTR